jgi:transaldolase
LIWPALGFRVSGKWICPQVDLPGGLRYTPRTGTAATNLHLQSRFPDMKIFLDSADINEIKTYIDTGFVDGVTTNPSLIAKSGRNILEAISEICSLVDGPVSAEVAATDYETMIAEGRKLAKLADNVTVKVPLTEDGLRTCRTLSDEGTDVNVTLCFTAGQALLAAKAGATFISPFVGRLDDIGQDGMGLIEEIVTIYDQYGFDTEVLVASVRSTQHVVDAATMGADVVTLPPKILGALYKHPLTDKGLAAFISDWEGTGQSIL